MEEAQKSTDKGEIYEAKLLTVKELLKGNIEGNSKVRYIIPRYQRGYVWTEEDVQNLINDIKESIENNSKQYFLGEIVLSKETLETDEIYQSLKKDKSDVFEVIDGQQRLTTLTLVIAATYKYLIKRKEDIINYSELNQEGLLDMQKDTKNLILRDPQRESFSFKKRGTESFTVVRVDDLKNCYEQILNTLIKSADSESPDCLINGINSEYEGCKKLSEISKLICENIFSMSVEEIEKFIDFLLNKTNIVVTVTSDIETAYKVFETLNDRGKGLGPEDLLKNFLFYKVFSNKEMYDEIDNKWKKFSRAFEKRNIRIVTKTTTEFLKKYIRIIGREKEIENDKKILKIFKGLVYDSSENEQKRALEVINDLIKVVEIYNELTNKSNMHYEILKESLDFKLGFDIIAALIYKLGENEYNNHKDEILSYVTAFFLVFSVSENIKKLSTLVPYICEKIYNSKEEETVNTLKNIIKEEINKLREEFKNKIILSTMATSKKGRKNAIKLLQIANYFLEGNKVQDASLEHILPQIEGKCTDYKIDEKSKKDYIGNLTLIPRGHNSSANNRCFKEKIDVYKTSNVYITRSIYEDMPIDNTQRRKYKDIYHTNKNESKYFCFAEEDSEKKIKVWSEKSIDDRTKGLSELLTYVLIDEINNDNIDRKLYSLVI